jgi:hypothetical protein
MSAAPEPSTSLLRAVRAEDARLERALQVLDQRRAAVQAQLAALDRERRELQERRGLLAKVAGADPESSRANVDPQSGGHTALKGRELRRVAGRLLWQSQHHQEIHYREWFERVLAAGYAVGGKDPAASFLTNVRDSPAVDRGSAPGMYRIDRGARERVGQAIGELSAELDDLKQSMLQFRREQPSLRVDVKVAAELDRMRVHRRHLEARLRGLEADAEEIAAITSDSTLATPETEKATGSLRAA